MATGPDKKKTNEGEREILFFLSFVSSSAAAEKMEGVFFVPLAFFCWRGGRGRGVGLVGLSEAAEEEEKIVYLPLLSI